MDEYLHSCIDMLNENEISVRNNAIYVLLNICEKILTLPEEEKYHKLYLNDPDVVEKLLPANGAMNCLFEIGFIEDGDCLCLPKTSSLTKLETLQKLLSSIVTTKTNITNSIKEYPVAEPQQNKDHFVVASKHLNNAGEKETFFRCITEHFNRVMRYEDKDLQEKAKKVIPLVELEIKTMSRLRKFQKNIKHVLMNKETELDIALKEDSINLTDLFLLELLHWFKYDFFQWIDSPICSSCSKECEFDSLESSSDPKCSRIEIHRCMTCKATTNFPRYTDPEILLSTRFGRCGEWANVFTLLCRSLNYDARLVHDVTDHIWTEVWSVAENRWIHVDPCENIMDQPLMYERGWNKKLSYIIAYSRDEVQDVTWRYTRNQNDIMARRKKCSEENLLQLLQNLNESRQNSVGYSKARKQYVIKRRFQELIEILHYPNIQNDYDANSYKERTTGSYAWRMARGEISQCNLNKSYTWDISKYGKSFNLQYYIVKNIYEVTHCDGHVLEQKSDWQEGVNYTEGGIFHKTEDDWKMAYLVRAPGTEYGYVRWSFEVKNSDLCVEIFSLKAKTAVFHGGNIAWEVEGLFPSVKEKDISMIIPICNSNDFTTDKLKGALRVNLTVKLSGGKDGLAWQHAQLFRESINNIKEPCMTIAVKLDNRRN